MMLPDVNILVQAFRTDASEHRVCHRWLEGVINADARFAMSPQVLAGFVRIATHPRVFAKPSGLGEALRYCGVLLDQPHCMIVQPGERHWDIFTRLCADSDARGNLVPDAWHAALAIESGCEWVTLDQDYARFRDLRWRTPR